MANADTQNLTIEQIGERAGVSRSTVSRVINNHPDVRESVRQRVEAVIAETGYEPNQAARALVSNRTGLIGLVMFTDVDELFGDPYYSGLVEGIQRGCAEQDLKFAIFPLQGCPDDGDSLPPIAQGFVDGVIVTASAASEPLIANLRRKSKRMVVVGHPRQDDGEGILRVDVDNRVGTAKAVSHLIDRGRRRVGFIGVRDGHVFAEERLDGYRDALASAGIAFIDELVGLGEVSPDGGYEATQTVLSHDPDALFTCTDTMAVGAYRLIAERGLSIPDDIAVIGFDGLPRGPVLEPALSTVVQPVVQVGRRAVELLTSTKEAPHLEILPTELCLAASSP